MATQIVLKSDLSNEENSQPDFQDRIKRILMLQLGTVVGRFTQLKAELNQAETGQPGLFSCNLEGTLRSGEKLEVTMVNTGIHVCVADAGARLTREVRRYSRGAQMLEKPQIIEDSQSV